MRLELTYTPPQLDIFFPEKPERHTIIPKGRRFGATRGAAHACIEWCIEGMPILWGDTIRGNIERYWDRYFRPALNSNGIEGDLNTRTMVATIGSGYIDFRSADRPENWEGFGYRKIILNEAGIILQDTYLYTNAVRPMMLDHTDAELFALGVPKGKMLKTGKEHPFYTMWQRLGQPGYRGRAYSSYDNKLLSADDISELETDIGAMDPAQVRQEIWGEFIDRVAGKPFAFNFNRARHVKPFKLMPGLPVIISVDFNLDPFCAIICQEQGTRFGVAHEVSVNNGTMRELCERLRAISPAVFLHKYTGDRSGAARRIQAKSTASLWDDFLAEIPAREPQLTLPPNPTHRDSREQVNYALHHLDIAIDPSCTGVIYDLENVEVDADLSIIKADRTKAAQRADFLDTFRYGINTYLSAAIERHRRTHAMQQLPGGAARMPVRR